MLLMIIAGNQKLRLQSDIQKHELNSIFREYFSCLKSGNVAHTHTHTHAHTGPHMLLSPQTQSPIDAQLWSVFMSSFYANKDEVYRPIILADDTGAFLTQGKIEAVIKSFKFCQLCCMCHLVITLTVQRYPFEKCGADSKTYRQVRINPTETNRTELQNKQ